MIQISRNLITNQNGVSDAPKMIKDNVLVEISSVEEITKSFLKTSFNATYEGQTLFAIPVPLGKKVIGFYINNFEQELDVDYSVNYLPTQTELTWLGNAQFQISIDMNLKISYI